MTQEPALEPETSPSEAAERAASGLMASLPQALLLARSPSATPGLPRVYTPPTDNLRSEARETLYLKALNDVARIRFAFPTPDYPDFKTYANQPQRSMGIQMSNGSVAYPDLVVVQHPENYTQIVAQVETNETVREDVAHYEWRLYANLAPLYLYVPVGKGDEALTFCRRSNIPVVGIRTWRYVVGYEGIELNDHYTVPKGPEDLLPKFLRPTL